MPGAGPDSRALSLGCLLLAAASPRPLRTAAQVSLSLQTSTVCCTLLINRACTFQLSRPGSVPAVGCCTSRRVIAQPLPSAPWSTPSLARAQLAAPGGIRAAAFVSGMEMRINRTPTGWDLTFSWKEGHICTVVLLEVSSLATAVSWAAGHGRPMAKHSSS